jgi:transcriptional regulator with XRE-family HTH domain
MSKEGFGQLLGALIRERREAAGMTQRELAEESFDLADHEGKERRIRELELGEVTRPQARNYTPICETLNIDRSVIRALKKQAADAKAQNDAEFNEVIEDRGSVEAALSDTSLLNRSELERLADRFGIEAPEAQPDAALAQLLSLKAEEYRALKAEVEAIGETYQRLSNLKAAARDAIARGNLEEVEDLLGRVQEVELEEAAKTAELRAQNALLRGNVEQAYRLLSAAADSFAAVDEVEPCRRRNDYRETLYRHGLRFGGNGLQKAVDIIRPAIAALESGLDNFLWASYTQNLGIELETQGTRTAGEAGAALLAEAVEAYRAALRVFTEAAHPVDWGATMQNLGIALATQGTRTAGEAGAALLAEAVEAYSAALRVTTEAAHPVEWAGTMQNLGNALSEQGTRTAGKAGAALLAEAVEAYSAALRVRTEAAHPVQWAMTMQNLGGALSEQGTRTAGEAGAALLAEAVEAYSAALRVRTEAAHPVQWAMTMQNLGAALETQGSRTAGEAGAALLAEAVEAYRAALRVRTEAAHPVQWAMTQPKLGAELEARAQHDATADPRPHLEEGLAHVAAALRVFDPEQTTFYYEFAIGVQDRLQAALDALESRD